MTKRLSISRKRLDLNPEYAEPYALLGGIYVVQGKYAEAITNL